MIVFSNCKINLGLRILRKRTDGYHDLETVFYPLLFHDAIEAIRSEQPAMQFTTSGIGIDAAPEQNLCMKAYDLLKQSHELPSLKLHLHKSIPAGAGLGGGSANAAFTLKLLNAKFNLGLKAERLLDLALQLGSDCPFFIINKPCIATGRGEIMDAIDLSPLKRYYIAIVNPGIHIPTAWAFSRIKPGANGPSIKDVIHQPVHAWKDQLVNDFEAVVFDEYPAVKNIKEGLYNKGAVYAAMSGSGSTVYGLFEERPVLEIDGFVRIIEPDGD
ncbi:MAG: 4-(cytidine 5'-diphospho)-2-C-methyl-D-erythritol kinase [Chitinophagaceae bacterium]